VTDRSKRLPEKSSRADVDKFLRKVAQTPLVHPGGNGGRLIFAMDATGSREPTWDRACQIQGEMFSATAELGGLNLQLCYYRGLGEFYASPWLTTSKDLLSQMTRVRCIGGITQIGRVLNHALNESARSKVDALVFIGDCMEEDIDKLSQLCGQLGLRGVPAFVFHEGHDPIAERAFREMARLTRGAYCRFDSGSARLLQELLGAVAVYAAGGRKALEDFTRGKQEEVRLLTSQIGNR